MQRPDTCYLTHVYVKQELSYLARRVDEVARYFLALEQMVGTGVLGAVLQRTLHELEERLGRAGELEDVDEVRGLIDAAIRLGLGPGRYAPLRERLEWLEHGRRRKQLCAELSAVSACDDATKLRQLIDEAVRHGIDAAEVNCARKRLREVEQALLNEAMLAAAARGDAAAAERLVWQGADREARAARGGATLWHLAGEMGDPALAALAERLGTSADIPDALGRSPLMTAAARTRGGLVRELLRLRADVARRTPVTEQVLELRSADGEVADGLETPSDLEEVLAMCDTGGCVKLRAEVMGVTLDVGDQLLLDKGAGHVVVSRVSGRTALHVAALHAGPEGAALPVVEALLEHNADPNALDVLGRGPLWYAAQGGQVAEARALLRAGASVTFVNVSTSPLIVAASGHPLACERGELEAAGRLEELCRLLLRSGAGRDPHEAASAALQFGSGFEEVCRAATNVDEALRLAGAAAATEGRAVLTQLATRYRGRPRRQRGHLLAGPKEAAALASAARAEFQALVFRLARESGCRAIVGGPPGEVRLMRLARRRGLLASAAAGSCSPEAAFDWRRVTDALRGTLVFASLPAVYRALAAVEARLGPSIRAVGDASLEAWGCGAPASSASGVAGAAVLLEVGGAVCLLRLMPARAVEAEEAALAEGSWLREELRAALDRGSVAEVHEAVDFAREHVDTLRIRAILNAPLAHNMPAAICVAVKAKHATIVELLLDATASPDAQDHHGRRALELAAKALDLRCFELLLSAGADGDPAALHPELAATECTSDDEDDENLELESSSGFARVARRLLLEARTQRGIDGLALAQIVQVFDGSPTDLAAAARLLKAGADANRRTSVAPDGEGMSLLSCATARGSLPLVRLLLGHGAKVQASHGAASALRLASGTPLEAVLLAQAYDELQQATASQDVPAVHGLLQAGLDPEARVATDLGARTLLAYATGLSPELGVPLMEALLDLGAALEARDAAGQTPLLIAAATGAPVVSVGLLLARGADFTAVDARGRTALMLAAEQGSYATLQRLLDAGVDGAAEDAAGHNALQHALHTGQTACLLQLQERGYALSREAALKELFVACRAGNAIRTATILDACHRSYPGLVNAEEGGPEASARPTSPTLLMEAVRAGSTEVVEVLLERGARLHPRTGCGTSAWALAGAHGPLRAALRMSLPSELLRIAQDVDGAALAALRQGEALGLQPRPEDFEFRCEGGRNALDYAVEAGFEELEVWLLAHGARLCKAVDVQVTLLEPAKRGDLDMVRRRLAAGACATVTDDKGRTAVDWCILAANINGLVWKCAERAVARSEVDGSFKDDDGSGSEPSGSGRRPSGNSVTLGSLGRPNAGLPALGGFRRSQEHDRQSAAGRSVSGASRASWGTGRTNSRRAVGGRPDEVPDPRGSHAAVEAALLEAGGRLGASVRSALFCLAQPLERRDFEAVRRRIAGGADCSVATERGAGLAHTALDCGNPQLAAEVVQAGASPDARDRRGRTVLWRAVEQKQVDIVEVCLARNADLSLGLGSSNDGSLAHLALETGQPDLAVQLLRGGLAGRGSPPDKLDTHGRTVLLRALELRQAEVARVCLALHADAAVTDSLSGQGVLHLALERQQAQLVGDLLASGAAPTLADRRGNTPLLLAASSGEVTALQELMEAGATPGVAGGREALLAAEGGHFRAAAMLVRAAGPCDRAEVRRMRRGTGPTMRERLLRIAAGNAGADDNGIKQSSFLALAVQAMAHADVEATAAEVAAAEAAKEAAAAYLGAMLEGSGLEQPYAERLAERLARWAADCTSAVEQQARGAALELLPATIIAEGARAAAGDLSAGGVHADICEELSRASLQAAIRGNRSTPRNSWLGKLGSRSDLNLGASRSESTSSASPTGRCKEATPRSMQLSPGLPATPEHLTGAEPLFTSFHLPSVLAEAEVEAEMEAEVEVVVAADALSAAEGESMGEADLTPPLSASQSAPQSAAQSRMLSEAPLDGQAEALAGDQEQRYSDQEFEDDVSEGRVDSRSNSAVDG